MTSGDVICGKVIHVTEEKQRIRKTWELYKVIVTGKIQLWSLIKSVLSGEIISCFISLWVAELVLIIGT